MTLADPVGRVVSLHRYPVKSMSGEDLDEAEVTPGGLLGDRAYALVDRSSGRVVSAKRPNKWPGILDYGAAFTEPPAPGGPVPEVRVTLPDGATLSSAEREPLDRRLSDSLGTSVKLESVVPAGASFEYHWPDMDGLVYEGRAYRDEITEHDMPPGTFFDSSSLLILTTASLAHLSDLVPGSRFETRRFRPNIVVEPAEGSSGFVENDWVGRTLSIGDDVRVDVTKPCLRCVMVTLPQKGLPKDPRVLRAAFDHNEGHVGVSGSVVRRGHIATGDSVWID